MPDEHDHRTEPERLRPLAGGAGDGARTEDSASPGRSSLITAVEIENFKGIGRPIRVDLRPITLLFGRNSAGKSTILHALCYAHEILSHRSVDARKTGLAGKVTSIRICRWRIREVGPHDFHARYVVTDRGGYRLDKGLDEEVGVGQSIALLSDQEWERVVRGYGKASPFFDKDGDFTVP